MQQILSAENGGERDSSVPDLKCQCNEERPHSLHCGWISPTHRWQTLLVSGPVHLPRPCEVTTPGRDSRSQPRKCRPMVHGQSALEPCGRRCVSEAGTRNGLRCRGHLHSHGPAPNARRSQPPIESCWSRSLCQQPIYTHGVRMQLRPTGQEGSLQGAPRQVVQEETMCPLPGRCHGWARPHGRHRHFACDCGGSKRQTEGGRECWLCSLTSVW